MLTKTIYIKSERGYIPESHTISHRAVTRFIPRGGEAQTWIGKEGVTLRQPTTIVGHRMKPSMTELPTGSFLVICRQGTAETPHLIKATVPTRNVATGRPHQGRLAWANA